MILKNKISIITGATSGIGLATVKRFLDEGAAVLTVGRNRVVLDTLIATTKETKERFATCEMDVTHPDAPARITEAALSAFGNIDILVNAAGIIGSTTLEKTTDEAWDQMLNVNLRAPFRLMRAVAPHLANRRGAIVNVSSIAGLRVFPNLLPYCVSKAGLDQLTRCAAIELAPLGVRVNGINPGVVITNLHLRSGMEPEKYSAFLERCKETHPLGRPGLPEEIAELILFLASDKSGWMTGETMAIDGGRHLTCAR